MELPFPFDFGEKVLPQGVSELPHQVMSGANGLNREGKSFRLLL